jgi:hypothetical protein
MILDHTPPRAPRAGEKRIANTVSTVWPQARFGLIYYLDVPSNV